METCGLPKATVHRICALLSERGYLRQPIGARALVPGPRLLELANAVLSHQSLGAVRHAVLEALAREVGETCNIAIPAATHMRSEEHTSELQSLMRISYAVFCLKKKKQKVHTKSKCKMKQNKRTHIY